MPDRAAMLAAIASAYDARQAGDRERLAMHFASGATFRLAARSELVGFDAGPTDVMIALDRLIETFEFHELERVHEWVDGNAAIVHSRIHTSTGGRSPETSELCDIWTFDDDLKVTSILEFADSALIAHMIGHRHG